LKGIVDVLDSHKITALINWLAAGAPPKMAFVDLIAEIGKRMVATGLPIDLFGIYNTMIHPQLPGRFFYWTEAGGSRLNTISSDQLRHGKSWVGSPAQVCQNSSRLLIYNIGESPEYDSRPDMKSLAERGYKQSVFTPLHSQYLLASSISTYSTKQNGGFTQEETHALRMIQAQLARIVEAFVLYEGTVQILSTYVGRGAGQRVLRGNISRGDAEIIPSIVLFTDLKDFTSLSNTRPAREVIEILNKFYDIAESAIGKNGGEILKFMGDGLLVIFPTPDDLSAQMAAAAGAIAALEETRRELAGMAGNALQFRAALHLGDIHYGNIGSKTRLDFTAIGPTVNLAARLMSAADEFGKDTVCSHAFHQLVPDRTTLTGEKMFKGFDTPQQVFYVNS
jgi:adenylate cyclase